MSYAEATKASEKKKVRNRVEIRNICADVVKADEKSSSVFHLLGGLLRKKTTIKSKD